MPENLARTNDGADIVSVQDSRATWVGLAMTPIAAKAQVDTAHNRYAEPARYQFAIPSRHDMTVKLALIAGAAAVIIAQPEQTAVALWGAGAALALMEAKSLTVTLKGKGPGSK